MGSAAHELDADAAAAHIAQRQLQQARLELLQIQGGQINHHITYHCIGVNRGRVEMRNIYICLYADINIQRSAYPTNQVVRLAHVVVKHMQMQHAIRVAQVELKGLSKFRVEGVLYHARLPSVFAQPQLHVWVA